MISLKYTVDLNQDGNERGGENPESLVPLEGNINQSLATNQRRQEFREILDWKMYSFSRFGLSY